MAYTVLDRVYSIFIDVMTGVSSGNGNATFYNTDSHTSYIEVTVTNGVQPFNMTEYNYVLVIDKPNKQIYRNEYTTTDESKLVIEMDSQMLAGVGNNKGQLYIMKTTDNIAKVLTMVEFNYIVKEGNYSEIAPESTDHDALYVTLRNDVDNILQMIENGEIGGGSGGTGMTSTQKEQLATAYNHAMTDAVTTTEIVNSAVVSYVEANRDTLKGDKGDKGDPGAKGEAGTNGKDGLTTAVSVNGNTYTHVNGTITLPNYPTVPTKTSQLANDSSFATESYVTTKIAEASLSGGEVDLSGYAKVTDLPTKTSQLANDSGFITAIPSEYVTETEVGTAISSYVTEHKAELKGDPGEKGDTGAKGDKGDPGAKGDTGDAGAKGDKGDKGDKGADGVTPTLSIGTVTTGAAGSSANVTMGGTAPAYVLNFTIPKGDKGDKGDTGASGSGGITIETVNNAIVSRETGLAKVVYASSVEITDIRSYIDVTGDITITLPSYSGRYSEANPFTYEYHVYMKFTDSHTVTFADTIKWQSIPTVKAGTVIDFIFNFIHVDTNTNFWLGGAVVYE